MTIEVWSDVACPYCYLGSRRLDLALDRFAHRDEVVLVRKSFQLDPRIEPGETMTLTRYLAERKGIPPDRLKDLHAGLATAGAEIGLAYHFDSVVVANTLDAHRLLQWAAADGHDAEVERLLFAAYFSDGRNIADREVLVELATVAGLNPHAARELLASERYRQVVRDHSREATELGASGVPFFVFDRRYAIEGAQPQEAFDRCLEQTYAEATAATS